MLPVRLFHAKAEQEIIALVDSGADECLFHADLAELLGIDLSKVDEHKPYQGIGGKPIEAPVTDVTLQVVGDSEKITVHAGFLPDLSVAALLGQRDFFDYYKVIFERSKERFQLMAV